MRKQFNFWITTPLQDASERHAEELSLPTSVYARRAVQLLGFASLEGFSTAKTRLLRDDDNPPVALPRLAIPAEGPLGTFRLALNERENEHLQSTADAAGISRSERLQRGLRLMNFISEQGAWPYAKFEHEDQRHMVILDLL